MSSFASSAALKPNEFAALVSAAAAATLALPAFASMKAPQSVRDALALLSAPDLNGFAPIHHAAVNGNTELVALLGAVFACVRSPVVDVRDRRGMTALQWAIQRGQGAVIAKLVEVGASLTRQDAQGRDALHHAIIAAARANASDRSFYYNMVRFLLQAGADVTQKDSQGATALHMASGSGDVEMVGILLEIGGSPINAKDDEGETALYYAIREGQLDAAKSLMDHGVDLRSSNSSNENIVDFCRALGDSKALSLFIASPTSNFTGSDSAMELDSSANMFGSNTFRPSFQSNSNHLIR